MPAAVLMAVAIWCSSASAEVTHPFLFGFNGSETPTGTLTAATGIAVSAGSGDVYVLNGGAIDRFGAEGKYICEITGAGSASTSPSECDTSAPGLPEPAKFKPEFIAVDNSAGPNAGDLYVAWSEDGTEMISDVEEKIADGVIARFAPSGALLSEFTTPIERQVGLTATSLGLGGLAVDGYGHIWVRREGGGQEVPGFGDYQTVSEYDADGQRLQQFAEHGDTLDELGTPLPVDFTVDFGTYLYGVGEDQHGEPPAFGVSRNEIEADQETVERVEPMPWERVAGEPCGEAPVCQAGLATDIATDSFYVLYRKESFEHSDVGHVSEFGVSGTELATFGQPQLEGDTGKAFASVNPRNGEIYVCYEGAGEIYVYGPAPGPRALPDEPSEAQTTSLKLNGEVDPEGAQSTYQFEWGTRRDYGNVVPVTPGTAGAGNAFVPVTATISGLQPGTTYHYRIVASNANGTFEGADVTASTKPVPTVDAASATDVQQTSADLKAEIDPKGNEASYRIEYGPSTEYGQSTEEVAIGSGSEDVSVSRRVEGLSPNVTYHWRVVVSYPEEGSTGHVYGADREFIYLTEAQGSTGCPNEPLRTGPSAALPECRAYELVTPPQKNGAVFGLGFAIAPPLASAEGTRVIASSIQPPPGAQAGTADRESDGEPYALERTEAGWTTSALAPAASEVQLNRVFAASADNGAALFSGPSSPADVTNFYVRAPSGALDDVGPVYPAADGAVSVVTTGEEVVGYTPDYSDFVYQLSPRYEWPFDKTYTAGNASLYEYIATNNSEPLLVGVSGGAASTKLISQCGTVAGGSDDERQGDVSGDGRVVYFTALSDEAGGCPAGVTAPPTDELYARVEASHTAAISARSRSACSTSACKDSQAGDAEFVGASEDGSRALFLDNQQLTDEATQGTGSARGQGCATGSACNLYMYDFSEPEASNLIDVSSGDTSGQSPQVQGVLAISPDGSHVYFVAKGVLSTAADQYGQSAEAGADNLYDYERDSEYPEGHTAFVATLPASDSAEWNPAVQTDSTSSQANVTSNGGYLVFTSHGDLTPGDLSPADAPQVFRYDAQAETLVRVSIGERGFDDNGNEGSAAAAIAKPVPHHSDSTMSEDGSHVFFQSPVGLTPEALNMVRIGAQGKGEPSYAQNVYEWAQDGVGSCSEPEGCVYLISDGHDTSSVGEDSTSAVQLIGADATGQNVFFSTSDPLVPQANGTGLNYYDARVGGGFPAPETPVQCEAEACQGSSSPAQLFGPPTSALLTGSGNLAPPRSKVKPASTSKRCARGRSPQHGKCVKTGETKKKQKRMEARRRCAHDKHAGRCAKATRRQRVARARRGETRGRGRSRS